MIVYQCEDSLESILTAVYLAYEEKRDHKDTRISLGEQSFLFSEEYEVKADERKAIKVMRTLRRQFGEEDFMRLCYALTTEEEEKGQAVYRTIVRGLADKARPGHLFDALSDPYVYQAFVLSQRAGREAHHLMGFVRFQEWKGGILYGRIAPKNNILPYLMEHFSDRLPEESFILQDEKRKIAGLHPAKIQGKGRGGEKNFPAFEMRRKEEAEIVEERGWYLAAAGEVDEAVFDRMVTEEERNIAAMFRYFCKNIAIKERKNLKLQQNLLPLRFQEYMTEFDKNR